jgi:CspA family cold shock protein
MEKGTVAKITDRGFGFISREGQDKDLFFHINEFEGDFDALKEGDELTFEVVDGEKGPSAVNVKKA